MSPVCGVMILPLNEVFLTSVGSKSQGIPVERPQGFQGIEPLRIQDNT
jgi:hypothetical protein